jgi:MSHA biogenesis protein MshP
MTVTAKSEQGFSIIMAVFILVVLGLLAAAMLSIMSAGADSVAREVLSSRALMAAKSGAERKLNEIFPPGAAANPSACQTSPATTYADFTGLVGCSNVSVVVDCTFVTVNAVSYFTVTSEGRCGPTSEPAVRIVELQAKDSI